MRTGLRSKFALALAGIAACAPPPWQSAAGGLGAAGDAEAWPERIARERALAEHDPAHRPRLEGGGATLNGARFDRRGATVRVRRASADGDGFGLRLASVGRVGATRDVGGDAAPEVAGPEVRFRHAPSVVEWWRSLPSGLEQGVTLDERPAGAGALVLEMALRGGARAEQAGADDVRLRDPSGTTIAHYAHLLVLDAHGRRVPARLAAVDARIRIEIDDRGARYPLVVDPLLTVEEAVLAPSDASPEDQAGVAVALSGDATRALVGVYGTDNSLDSDVGSVRVFVRSGSTWSEEAVLADPTGRAGDALGLAVALSADGSVAVAGAQNRDVGALGDAGSAYVFVRTGSTWAREALLTSAAPAGGDEFGGAVAVSADGTRALVGAPHDDTGAGIDAGSVSVFRRVGTSWTPEVVLAPAGGAFGDAFGWSVAVSADGTRALVGAWSDDVGGMANAGSARVFARSGTVWTEEAALGTTAPLTNAWLGHSVALSASADRAVVGAPGPASGLDGGAARVFVRTGTSWLEEALLVAPDAEIGDQLGGAVAMSADGSRVLIGDMLDDTAVGTDAGSARLFVRGGTAWMQDTVLTSTPPGDLDAFGCAVALSGDGVRALVGARYDDTSIGTNAGNAHVYLFATAPDGAACGTDATCRSGFCVDEVCCADACGGGASDDCLACSVAAGAASDGTCSLAAAGTSCRPAASACDMAEACTGSAPVCPSDDVAPPTTPCRPAAGSCDAVEMCTGTSGLCPADLLVPAAAVCRPASGTCDVAEACTGTTATCPPNGLVGAGTMCRPPMGVCGAAERCSGVSPDCPLDTAAIAGTTCRNAVDVCDVAEVCDGRSFDCPFDAFVAASAPCRPAADACDAPEQCSGTSAACPADAFRAAGTVCRDAASDCDAVEMCSGSSVLCPTDAVASAGTICGAPPSGVCDAADRCTGTTVECRPEYLSGAECRPALGACDLPEFCAGSSVACPPDVVVSSGISCRASTGTSCDPEEACDGTATVCPIDVNECAPPTDAGPRTDAGDALDAGAPTDAGDAGGAVDVGRADDAGAPPVATAGCGCANVRTPGGGATVATLLAVATIARRRRRVPR